MKNLLLRYLVFIAFLLGMGACVSVKLPSGSGTPAKNLKFNAPENPYQEIKVLTGDKAWLSSKTGNTISFLSDCNGTVDPSLQQLESESLAVLDKLNILQTKTFDFNGREALRTQAQGEVDGVPVKTELIVFKKNNCNYTLSYGGVFKSVEAGTDTNFNLEKKYFDSFTESFRAP